MATGRQVIMQGALPCSTGSYEAAFEARRLPSSRRRERRARVIYEDQEGPIARHRVDPSESCHSPSLKEGPGEQGHVEHSRKGFMTTRWKVLLTGAFLIVLLVKGILPISIITAPGGLLIKVISRNIKLRNEPALYQIESDRFPELYSDPRAIKEFDELKEQYSALRKKLEITGNRYNELDTRLAQVEAVPDKDAVHPPESEALQRQIQQMARQMQELAQKNQAVQTALDKAVLDEYDLRREIEHLKSDTGSRERSKTGKTELTDNEGNFLVNAASQRVGAVIEKGYSTPSADGLAETLVRKIATSLGSDRFDAVRRREARPISTVLLADPITGSGDCHKINGNQADITIRLPYPVVVRAVEIEQARPQLELSPEWSPRHVSVFVAHSREFRPAVSGSGLPSEPLVDFPFDLSESHLTRVATPKETQYTHRVRFHLVGNSNALCIYRVRVFGIIPPPPRFRAS